MAKLQTPLRAGFNAGENYFVKMVRCDDIIIDPEISKVFTFNPALVEGIYQNILSQGYDKSQPVVLLKGMLIILDGHHRLAASKRAKLEEIPAIYKEFEDRESAIMYTFERQALRRNLAGREILSIARMIIARGKKEYDGKGRVAEILAKRFNISVSRLYQALAIEKYAPPEIKEQICSGEISIKKGYNTTKSSKPDKPDIEFYPDMQGLPASVKFLKSAVTLLVKANQSHAAEILINHFLKKHERNGFAKLLPYEIKNLLEKEFATPCSKYPKAAR